MIYIWDEELLTKWTTKIIVFTAAMLEICASKSSNTILYLEHVNSMDSEILVKFLESVQRIWAECATGGEVNSTLTVIGSTFEPKQMVKEVVMHFTKRIYVPTPNFQERKQLIVKYLVENGKPGENINWREKDVEWLAKKLAGCVPIEIETKIGELLEKPEEKQEHGKLVKGLEGILCRKTSAKVVFQKK